MKTIYLIRHAKSSWDIHDLPDIDRPLNERGFRDAHKIGKILGREKVKAGLIISSPAVRAITTALIIARSIQYNEEGISIRRSLYQTGVEDYLDEIAVCNNDSDHLFLFGHNPVISETARYLLQKNMDEMPTCTVTGISFQESSWEKVIKSIGRLSLHLFPKLAE